MEPEKDAGGYSDGPKGKKNKRKENSQTTDEFEALTLLQKESQKHMGENQWLWF